MKNNVKWGIALIIVGIALQLHNLGIIESITIFWPTLIVLFGILMLFKEKKEETSSQ
jgi:hypothetical protein